MGIYDRDYYRQGGSGIQLRMPRTAVTAIILINVAVYIAEMVAPAAVVSALACYAALQICTETRLRARGCGGSS